MVDKNTSPEHQRIYGLHAVTAALQANELSVTELRVDNSRQDARIRALLKLAAERGVTVHYVHAQELDVLAYGGKHQGVVGYLAAQKLYDEKDLVQLIAAKSPVFLLVLDCIQDPHNLGACLRSADAAGIHAVIVPKDRSANLTATVRKVASGAAESVPLITVTNLARTLALIRELGVWVIGAAGDAPSLIYELDLQGPLAIVLGGEGKGMRRLTREHCDFTAKIPMFGKVESLNVSAAAAVFLFEAVRQRSFSRD